MMLVQELSHPRRRFLHGQPCIAAGTASLISIACPDSGIRGQSDPFAAQEVSSQGDEAMKAVRFDIYGDVNVLKVVEVDPPVAGPSRVVVRVKAAGINPSEAAIRRGLLAEPRPP